MSALSCLAGILVGTLAGAAFGRFCHSIYRAVKPKCVLVRDGELLQCALCGFAGLYDRFGDVGEIAACPECGSREVGVCDL